MNILSEEHTVDNFTANNNNEISAQENFTQAVNIDKLPGTQGVKSVANKPTSYACQLCCKMFTRKFNYKLHLWVSFDKKLS